MISSIFLSNETAPTSACVCHMRSHLHTGLGAWSPISQSVFLTTCSCTLTCQVFHSASSFWTSSCSAGFALRTQKRRKQPRYNYNHLDPVAFSGSKCSKGNRAKTKLLFANLLNWKPTCFLLTNFKRFQIIDVLNINVSVRNPTWTRS